MLHKLAADKKKKAPFVLRMEQSKFKVALLIILFLIGYYFVGILGTIAYGSLGGTLFIDAVLILYSVYYLFAKKSKQNRTPGYWREFDFHKVTYKWYLALFGLIILFILIYYIGQTYGSVIYQITKDSNFTQYQKSENSEATYLVIMCGVIVAPIAEELFYRGAIYNTLKAQYPVFAAWLIQALIFAVMHGTLVHLPGTFSLALFNALIYEIFGKLRWNMLAHITYNAAAFFVPTVAPKFLCNFALCSVIYTALIIILIALFVKREWLVKKVTN